MYCEKLLCAGFGGQGIMSLGQILAYAGMIERKQVTWLPSYGPEMRGGTAYCSVMISDQPVGSPLISKDATSAIIMNLPSLHKFESWIIPGGLLLINSSLITQKCTRNDLHDYYIPAVEEAIACGDEKMANMIMLGAYLQLTDILKVSSIIEAFRKVFGPKAKRLLPVSKQALTRGIGTIQNQTVLPAAI